LYQEEKASMANLDKSHFVRLERFFFHDWFVVHEKCAHELTFPENVIASALRHGSK